MILNCNSCDKRFVVPDNAITATGRLVQCSSCGNKWTQYPIDNKKNPQKEIPKIKSSPKKIKSPTKKTKTKIKKKDGPNLYSPEYLAKKHGIKISEKPTIKNKLTEDKTKISFGFYSFLIVSIVIAIFILRLLYFTQDIIVEKFPVLEIYINYLFESIRNMNEIIQNFLGA
ncbi:zinc-ribbon domain-containing protein [Pelagibacterales bacterium SAG-MED29]|nr:zinc-ribbon domain-containing protein [Pelagibacterales bacterium SAG-MED29]